MKKLNILYSSFSMVQTEITEQKFLLPKKLNLKFPIT